LSVVLNWCEPWSLTLWKKHRLRVSENKQGTEEDIFEPMRDGVTGDWRRLHNKDLYDLYHHQILFRWSNKKNETGVTCDTHEEGTCIQSFDGET